jgi:hypothetical protein
MRSLVHCPLHLRQHIGNGAFEVMRKVADGSPVMRFRRHSDGLEQHWGWYVAGVGDEWDGHPRAYWLVHRVKLPRLPAGPVGEGESARERKQKSEPQSQSEPP